MGKSSTSLLCQFRVVISSLALELWCPWGWQLPQEGYFESCSLLTFALIPCSLGHRVEGGRESPGKGLPLAKSCLLPAHLPSGLVLCLLFRQMATQSLVEWIINFNNKLNGFAFVSRNLPLGEGFFLKRLLG